MRLVVLVEKSISTSTEAAPARSRARPRPVASYAFYR